MSRKSIGVDGDDVATLRVDAGSRRDDLLHFGEIGIDLGLVGRLADHLGDAALVDDDGDRELFDLVAVARRSRSSCC